MAIRSNTPYGIFRSKKELLKTIMKDPFPFIVKYYHLIMKYQHDDWKAFHGNGTNTQTQHVVWSVLHNDLLGKDPNWKILPQVQLAKLVKQVRP